MLFFGIMIDVFQHVQDVAEIGQGWKVMPLVRKDSGKGSSCTRLISGDASSSGDECNTKVSGRSWLLEENLDF